MYFLKKYLTLLIVTIHLQAYIIASDNDAADLSLKRSQTESQDNSPNKKQCSQSFMPEIIVISTPTTDKNSGVQLITRLTKLYPGIAGRINHLILSFATNDAQNLLIDCIKHPERHFYKGFKNACAILKYDDPKLNFIKSWRNDKNETFLHVIIDNNKRIDDYFLKKMFTSRRKLMLKYLLTCNIDLEAKENEYNATAMHFAAYHRDITAIKLLQSVDANVDARDCDNDTPIYYTLLPKPSQTTSTTIKALVDLGANINTKSNCIYTKKPFAGQTILKAVGHFHKNSDFYKEIKKTIKNLGGTK